MRSFEIFVDRNHDLSAASGPAEVAPRSGLRKKLGREVLDVFVHGANVTATIAEGRGGCVLRDIAIALGELARVPRGKRIVHFYDDAWAFAIMGMVFSSVGWWLDGRTRTRAQLVDDLTDLICGGLGGGGVDIG